MDYSSGVVPASMNNSLVNATRSCIAVGTVSEQDGDTCVELLVRAEQLTIRPCILAYEGVIETPSNRLSVCSILFEELIGAQTDSSRSNVRVYVNNLSEPNKIGVVCEQLRM
jgi:hypothetical protein